MEAGSHALAPGFDGERIVSFQTGILAQRAARRWRALEGLYAQAESGNGEAALSADETAQSGVEGVEAALRSNLQVLRELALAARRGDAHLQVSSTSQARGRGAAAEAE